MELLNQATDSKKEETGIWVSFDGETQFLIGSLNSRRYKKAYGRRIEDIRRAKRNIEADAIDEIINDAYAEAILLGWKNVQENGTAVEYSVEKAKWIMANCPNVREFILATATNNENFRLAAVQEVKANAGESSTGS